MADSAKVDLEDPAATHAATDGAAHDGRFGKRFDDEVSVSVIVWSTFGLALACVLGMLITWYMRGYFAERAEVTAPPPSPVAEANERRLPPGPLLQRHPEAEMKALRREMAERLSGYGWVDEAAGVAHIPIDKAMDLLLERAAGAAGEAAAESDVEHAAKGPVE